MMSCLQHMEDGCRDQEMQQDSNRPMNGTDQIVGEHTRSDGCH